MMAQSCDHNIDSDYENFCGNKIVDKDEMYELCEHSEVMENVQGVKADVSPRSSDPIVDIPEGIPDSIRRHSTSSATPSRISAALEALQ